MAKVCIIIIFSSLIYYGCNRKQYICPAYNTFFIHDQKERDKLFLPFTVDSLGENTETVENTSGDSTNYAMHPENGAGSKYQPKTTENKSSKKFQPNGLVMNTTGKKKMRNVSDIEMKIIIAKPIAQFSNIDSSSFKKEEAPRKEEIQTDSL